MRPNFLHHLHPPTIPSDQARFRYTLGAGGLSVFFSLVVIITGILEAFYYIPTPEKAHASIQTIAYLVPFGALIRNLHFWSAQFLMLTVLIHLLRVIFTGSYTVPRRFNYFLGLLLLIVCLFLDFTGYVLRWDEDIRWALIAGTNLIKSIPALGNPLYQMIVGGQQISATALLRFYTWHIFGLMIIFLLLGTWHIFRVRRDGGIAVPQPGLRLNQARITRFDLVRREGMAAILATMGLLILSVVFPAHLAPAIDQNSGFSSDPRAPWFFLWIQQLLKIDGPFMMGIVIPLIVWIILLLFPFVFKGTENSDIGRWFPSGGRLAQLITFGLILAIMILTILAIDSS